MPQLLDLIDVEGAIVTADAMSCQKAIIEKIVECKAEYTIGLKLNQQVLFNDVKDYFEEFEKEATATKTSEKGHGRIETREYYLVTDISWLEQRNDWCGLKSVGMVKSNVIENGEIRTYTRYFMMLWKERNRQEQTTEMSSCHRICQVLICSVSGLLKQQKNRKNKMKRKTAKEILAESFRELAENKNIDKITVKDITENCGYSSATFYRHFKDKYDLIVWEHTQGVAGIMAQIGKEGYPWKQTLIDGANSFQKNKEYLENLLKHTTGHDSFTRNMTEINYNALKNQIMQANRISTLDEKTDMYIRLYCQGTVALTCDWIFGRYKATPEELAEVFENSLPKPLKQYLY